MLYLPFLICLCTPLVVAHHVKAASLFSDGEFEKVSAVWLLLLLPADFKTLRAVLIEESFLT